MDGWHSDESILCVCACVAIHKAMKSTKNRLKANDDSDDATSIYKWLRKTNYMDGLHRMTSVFGFGHILYPKLGSYNGVSDKWWWRANNQTDELESMAMACLGMGRPHTMLQFSQSKWIDLTTNGVAVCDSLFSVCANETRPSNQQCVLMLIYLSSLKQKPFSD